MLAQEIIRHKRDSAALSTEQIASFVHGLVDRSWSEGQVASMAMAIFLRGMTCEECVALTHAMTHSGQVLDWSRSRLSGPILDKHSTGGVGDKVSLILAPLVAACGGVVPMISGRGLGHTGGTLDKLASLQGYQLMPSRSVLTRVLREAGCAIVGASTRIAPADRRLYAIRDITATVESVPLITASILSKKLAAGLQGLVMDVKVGNGAFCTTMQEAQELTRSLIEVATGAGLPIRALITDMDQVLGHSAGNAIEIRETIDFLTGTARDPRLEAVTLALASHMLCLGGLCRDLQEAEHQARHALNNGSAAESFARMVSGLGGPRDVLKRHGAHLPDAPVVREVTAPFGGFLHAVDTRAIGLTVLALGAGRRRASDNIDPRVGLSNMLSLGSSVTRGQTLVQVHAANESDAEAATKSILVALRIAPENMSPIPHVVRETAIDD